SEMGHEEAPSSSKEPAPFVRPGSERANSLPQVALKYFLSCSASTVAETATYPLDITKTRLQIARKGAAKNQKTGMFRVTYNIVKNEGASSLWRGLAPAIYRHYIYTGIRMSIYESMRNNLFDRKNEKLFPLWESMACGLVSGAVAQFVASPTDLVKVQMQMEGLRKMQNLPPRFTSTWHAFSSLHKQHGFRGLWMGWIPNCQRAALLNMADMATYDRVKHLILRDPRMKDDIITHGLASVCSGFAAAIVSTPADVVKTRMMDQLRHIHDHDHNSNAKQPRIYKGSVDCLMHIVRKEGFLALYRGFIPIYTRMAPWSLLFWVSYEEVRRLVGAGSF
ncbi:hypothetical protein PENTCL1PPCAC_28305, partial [Pristionchus entomophagus]